MTEVLELIGAYGLTPVLGAGALYFGWKYLPTVWTFVRQANENAVLIKSLMERVTALEEENKKLREEYEELEDRYMSQGEELGTLRTEHGILAERFTNLQDRFEDKMPQSRGRRVA